jgi:hypothetical protein
MQVFTLCFLFLAVGVSLAPGITLSKRFSVFRWHLAISKSKHQSADRKPGLIRGASTSLQNFSEGRFPATAIAAAAAAAFRASQNRGRPEASQ